MEYFSSNDCNHIHTIDDHITGDIVCTDCALVLGAVYLHPTPVKLISERAPDGSNNNQNEEEHFIRDVCARGFINNKTRDMAISYMVDISRVLHKKFAKKDVASYALFEILIRQNESRTPQELHHISGVLPKTLKTIEKYILKISDKTLLRTSTASAEDFAERF